MSKSNNTGLSTNMRAALAVLLGWTVVVPFLMILIEKEAYSKFYAAQLVVVFVLFYLLVEVFGFVLAPLVGLLWIATVLVWLLMVYKAYSGEEYELPYIGEMARKLIGKL